MWPLGMAAVGEAKIRLEEGSPLVWKWWGGTRGSPTTDLMQDLELGQVRVGAPAVQHLGQRWQARSSEGVAGGDQGRGSGG